MIRSKIDMSKERKLSLRPSIKNLSRRNSVSLHLLEDNDEKGKELKQLMIQINHLLRVQRREQPGWIKKYKNEDPRAIHYQKLLSRIGLPEKHARFAPWFYKSNQIELNVFSSKLFEDIEADYLNPKHVDSEKELAITQYQNFVKTIRDNDLDPFEVNQLMIQRAFRACSFQVKPIDIERKKRLKQTHPALREVDYVNEIEEVPVVTAPPGLANPIAGKKESKGKHLYLTYTGRWKDGHMQSPLGVYTYADGGTYRGEWKDSKQTGSGEAEYPNGVKYTGGWKEGRYHGFGVLEYPNYTKYEGEWKDGVRHGKGKISFPSGSYYEGNYFLGYRQGHGVALSSTGYRYTGEWKENRIFGPGTLLFPKGKRFRKEDWPMSTFGDAISFAKEQINKKEEIEYLENRALYRIRDDLRAWELHKAYRVKKAIKDEEDEKKRKEKRKQEFKEKREAQQAAREAFLKEMTNDDQDADDDDEYDSNDDSSEKDEEDQDDEDSETNDDDSDEDNHKK